MEVPDQNFMTSHNILRAVKSIKMKNCEGENRIPQRIMIDGIEVLLAPLTEFKRIYEQKEIPEQWKLAKITPVHKKGNKNDVTNYRPIANLCSASKIFEKLHSQFSCFTMITSYIIQCLLAQSTAP